MSGSNIAPDTTVISWDISVSEPSDGSSVFDVVGTSDECKVTLHCADEAAAEILCDLLNSHAVIGARAERLANAAGNAP